MQQIAVVTGASRGIGLAVTKALVEHGYHTIMVSRDPHRLKTAHSSFTSSASYIPCDLSQPSNIPLLLQYRGVELNRLLVSTKDDEITKVVNTNLVSAMLLTRGVLRGMLKKRQGSIVNVSSVLGVSKGGSGSSVYSATKAGLVGFTKSLSSEVGRKQVRVNCICPGLIATDMTDGVGDGFVGCIPLGRAGRPEEVADVVLFLARNKYITGQSLVIDGGLSCN